MSNVDECSSSSEIEAVMSATEAVVLTETETDSNDDHSNKQCDNNCDKKPTHATNKLVRANASNGLWLCFLMPLAYVAYFMQNYTRSTKKTEYCRLDNGCNYWILTLGAAGMSLQSIVMYMRWQKKINNDNIIMNILPSFVTIVLYIKLMPLDEIVAIFWASFATLTCQYINTKLLHSLPRSFSYGESIILSQGLTLFLMHVLQVLKEIIALNSTEQIKIVVLNALVFLLLTCWLLASIKILRKTFMFYPLMAVLLFAVTATPVTEPRPVYVLFDYILCHASRVLFIGFCFILVAVTIATVWWQLQHNGSGGKASTRVRKIFHLLIVLVYMPGLLYHYEFLIIASCVALALLIVLELFRICDIPPLASVLKNAFSIFADEKDCGTIAFTPFSLLIGCSLPLWLRPCPTGSCFKGDEDLLALMAGILSIGIGDTAASIIGSKYGRNKWPNSSRTFEGTLAFIVAILLTVIALDVFGLVAMDLIKWSITMAATIITALVEAHTDQVDNLVLPLVFYIIICFA